MCVLDFRGSRSLRKESALGQWLAWAALLALAAICAGDWSSPEPASPLHFDDDAPQLTGLDSPTDFLPSTYFQPITPN